MAPPIPPLGARGGGPGRVPTGPGTDPLVEGQGRR